MVSLKKKPGNFPLLFRLLSYSGSPHQGCSDGGKDSQHSDGPHLGEAVKHLRQPEQLGHLGKHRNGHHLHGTLLILSSRILTQLATLQ